MRTYTELIKLRTFSDILLNPEYIISTCKRTHDAIHYGDFRLVNQNGIIEPLVFQ